MCAIALSAWGRSYKPLFFHFFVNQLGCSQRVVKSSHEIRGECRAQCRGSGNDIKTVGAIMR